jgi:hypothetical protein
MPINFLQRCNLDSGLGGGTEVGVGQKQHSESPELVHGFLLNVQQTVDTQSDAHPAHLHIFTCIENSKFI